MRRWLPVGAVGLAQVAYPLVPKESRSGLVIATVILGAAASVGHAASTRGARTAAALLAISAGGGLAVETLGVATGFPFGQYGYSGALGPRLFGVPALVPLAWTWMVWPAWLAGAGLARTTVARVALAGIALAAWDLFLDPQMVAAGYWHWRHPSPGLPGVPGVPLTDYAGWTLVALLMMAGLSRFVAPGPGPDGPMHALYLWTYGSGVLAHAVFFHRPGSALWGALGMGVVAGPLAVHCVRS